MSDAREASANTATSSTRLAGGETNKTNTVSDAREASASTATSSTRLAGGETNKTNTPGGGAGSGLRNKVAYAVIGAVVAVCAVGWAIIMMHVEGTPGIAPEVVSWQAGDRSVLVRFQVGKPEDRRVRCAVVAYDPRHGEVGRVAVTLPPGTAVATARREVPTSSRATAVDVRECRSEG